MKGFIVYAAHEIIENQSVIHLFGRLENNQSFVTINKFSPHFFIRAADAKKIPKKFANAETNLKNFQNEKVIKISAENRSELNKIFKEIHKKITTYEADIRPQMQFLIDKKIFSAIEISGDYTPSEKIDRIYSEPEITPAEFQPKLKVLSIDIESDKEFNNLFCIGLYSENYRKNFLVSEENKKIPDTIVCKTEADCLEKFRDEVIKFDPDIITGWNVIDFDFQYLREKFRKHQINFDIGRTNAEPRLKIETSFFRSSSIDIPGRQVLDGLNLFREGIIANSPTMRNINLKSFSLEDVAQSILKRGKTIKGKFRHDELEKLYRTNQEKLVEYNLIDCELAYEILEKTKLLDLLIERAQLTGLPLDKIGASIAAFDSLYIRESRKKNLVSPTATFQKKEERIKGGYVSSLNPGIYKNVLVLDFKSLYPSIIRTFNIDPSSYKEKCSPNDIKAPNSACFINTDGILPEIIAKLHSARENAKKEKRELANYVIKIIMNSFFGVLANPNCRYFSLEIANAITHFGQKIIKLTAEEIEKKFKHKVIYSDTDSVFIETSLEKSTANELGKEIQNYINNFYQNYVKQNYSRKSFLELEFEKQYLSLMIPKLRGEEKTAAAKKRYAGLIEKNGEEKIEIVGLEAIRGDWTEAAQEFQRELLMKIFHSQPIEQFIKEYVKKLNLGKLDGKLIYKKSIRKNLAEYTKTTPPHVKAARLLPKLESSVIEYYITTHGPEPIQALKHKINYSHYIEKQLKPIANQILSLFNKDFDEIIQCSKQAKLF